MPQGKHHARRQQHKIPVAQQFGAYHTPDVVFAGKLLKHGHRGAPSGVLKVHGITQVGHHTYGVAHHKHPFGGALPQVVLLQMQGQQHQHYIQGVGVENGRGVKHPSAFEHLCCRCPCKVGGKHAVVFQQKGQSAQFVNHIYQQQVHYQMVGR